MANWYIDPYNGASANDGKGWIKLVFINGTNANHQLVVGDTIVGATSAVSATVTRIDVTSGSWAGANAAGNIYVTAKVSSKWFGQLNGFTSSENLNWSSQLVAKMNAAEAWSGIDNITNLTAAKGLAALDTARVAQSKPVASMGRSLTWTNKNRNVSDSWGGAYNKIHDAVNTTGWTAATNITATSGSGCNKLAANNLQLASNGSFTTGEVAYAANATVDMSNSSYICFWLLNSAALSAGQLQIKFYSDAGRTVQVGSTLSIPAIPSSGQILPIVFDISSGWGSVTNANYIQIYANSTWASQNIQVTNFFHSRSGSPTLQGLISRASADPLGTTELWYPIKNIDFTNGYINIDNHPANAYNSGLGYSGVSGSGTGYFRECFNPIGVFGKGNLAIATSNGTAIQTPPVSATNNNWIYYEGGYDVGTDTQTGMTFFDGLNGYGYGIYDNSKTALSFNGFGFVRYSTSIFNSVSMRVSNISCVGNGGNPIYNNTYNATTRFDNIIHSNNNNNSISCSYINQLSGTIVASCNLGNFGIAISSYSGGSKLLNVIAKNNSNSGLQISGNCQIQTLTTADNASYGLSIVGGIVNILTANIAEATPIYWNYTETAPLVTTAKFNGTAFDSRQYSDYCTAYLQSSEKPADVSYAWKISPTNVVRRLNYPFEFSIGQFLVAANNLTTCSIRMKRDNANINGRLIAKAGQLAGMTNDTTVSCTNTGTWDLYQMTFTPTETGYFELMVQVYYPDNSSTYTYNLYVDTTQANGAGNYVIVSQ